MLFLKKPIFLAIAAIAVVFACLLILLPGVSSHKSLAPTASDSDSFSFAIIGDTQRFNAGKKNGGLQKAAQAAGREKVAFALAMGDLVSSCYGDSKCANKLKKWRRIVSADVAQVYPVMGNHDQTRSKADAVWQRTFSLPDNGPSDLKEIVYSFDYGDSHFVALNTGSSHQVNQEQLDWLEQDLTANQKTHTFVFFHEPAWPTGAKIGESLDVHPSERDSLWRILDSHNVTAVFSGHEHIYSRRVISADQLTGLSHSIPQFIVGNTDSFRHGKPRQGRADAYYNNKNYAIVEVNANNITMTDYSIGGNVTDQYQFSH